MKTNFLNLVAYDPIATQSGAKMPQNTGGGNLQTKRATLALPLRYLCAMLLALVLGIGNVWAAESATNNPATVEYGTGSAKKTFLDVSNTVSNATISTGSVACVTYGLFELDKNWKPAFYSGPANGTSSARDYSGAASVGFLPGSSAGSGTAANKSATSGYGAAKYKSTAPATIYVTGITGIAVLGKDADTKNEKRLYIKVEEYATDGTCTPVGEGDGVTKSSYSTALHITTFDAGTLSGTKYYKVTLYAGYDTNHETSQIRFTKYIIPTTKYTVTYKAGEGTGDDVVDSDAKTVKAFADCSFTAPSGYEFKEWQDAGSNVVAAGATVSADMTLTAIYRLIPTKYTVTYSLNGASGDAPTETDKAAGDAFNLAAAPSWAGHAFDGWLCNIDSDVKAAGSSYTMTAAPTTFTAQWHELDCKIYSFTGGIGSAIKESADKASVDADKLVLSGSAGVIKLVPAAGETFKAGDVITISGMVGNTAEAFGVKISASNAKGDDLGTASVAGTTIPLIASVALTGNADNLYISRKGGTTTTIYTCEVHRSCAEGTAAGLSYAEASVNKYTTDAAFTNPLTNANGLVIAGYTSSDAEVATVAANGQVTLVGAGTATITAHSAIQTKAGTLYAAGTASYTLTVTAPPTFAVTYDNNGGEGTMTDSNSPYVEGAEVTLLANAFTAPSGYAWSAWEVTETVSGNPVAVSEGKFTMPGVAVTVTAQWALIADFDVKFFQGYGDPDVQIGETQSISTSGHAVAPADPTRTGYAFLGWSYDATEAHIVDVAAYGITAATNFTAMWKAVWTVTFDGAGNVIVEDGETVASPDSPTQAGKIFQGWYNGESKYDFSATVTGNLALESKWAAANPNHFYYTYNDDFHFDGVVYKTPDGKTKDPEADEASNVALATNPYTLFSGAAGITSIVATNGIYDYKKANNTKHITAYLKLKADDATSNVVFTIASGYTAVLKLKMNGYSTNATISLKKGDDAVTPSGTQEGTAEGKNYGELTYNVTAGEYKLTTANKTLYISHIDLEATALPTHTVTYKAGDGTGDDVVDADATEVRDGSTMFTAPTGQVFNGWKDELDNDVEVGAIVSADMALTAQWINVYAVTFNMNGHGAAIDPQDIKEGAKAAKPADPVVIGQEFGGWFTDAACTEGNEFDFNTLITEPKELFAKWTAFDGCALLYPATSGADPAVGDEISMQSGSTGGTMHVVGTPLSYSALGLGFNSSASAKAKVTINNEIQEGTVISLTMVANGTDAPRGLHLYSGDGATKIASIGWTSTVVKYTEATFTYTVQSTDVALIGTNEFQLWRNGSVFLKKLTVTNCGDAITFHNLTSAITPDNDPAYATVTLGASSVREGHTTTATYSAIDAAYEFDEWQISGTGASIADASANPAVITMGTADAVVTLKLKVATPKYTVTFNKMGKGADIASQLVAEGALVSEPSVTEPEGWMLEGWYKESTLENKWDFATDVMGNTDIELFANWVADTSIKLINKSTGAINTTNFTTAVAAEADVDGEKGAVFNANRDAISSVSALNEMVQYNATTTQTKIQLVMYNTSSNPKTIYLFKVAEGDETAEKIEITIDGSSRKTTEYYTFNSDKNRSFYVTVSDKKVQILQVKVVESGTAIKQFGQAGYSLNFNKGRMFAKNDGSAYPFEGGSIKVSSDYKVLNNSNLATKSYIQFNNAVAGTILKVTRSGGNYYVSQDPEEKGTIYNANAEVELTATGTWYLGSQTSGSAASFTKIEFIAPKCEQPQFNALANSDICSGDPYVALDGTGTVTDGGTITYKWYAEGGTDVLGTDATYMPAEDGRYYVVALHHVDGYTDNEATSDVVTVTTHTGTAISEGLVNQRGVVDAVVTLTVTASGKNLHYTWKECATIDGTYTDVAGAADAASLNVTITEGLSKYYKVIVHSDCGADQESIAKVEQFVAVSQQDVTGSIVWDWTEAASVNEIKLSSSTTPKKNEGFVMANGAATVYNNANFESDKLYLEGEYIIRTEGGKLFQGQTIKFNTTVAGAVRVTFSHTGSNKPARELFINGVGTGTSVTGTSQTKTGLIEVPAGEVAITAFHVNPTDGAGQQYVRVYKIEFYAYDTERADSWIAPGELGTICYPNGHVFTGAEVYEMAGVDENNKFVFDQVEQTEPGKPYLFVATSYEPIKLYKTTAAAELSPIAHKGMIGTFVSIDLDYTDERAAKWYYFSGKKFYAVSKRTSDLNVPANRAYVDMNTPVLAGAPKHGVRRITFDVQGTNIATGVENAAATDKPAKMLINGQLFILRGEKMYDAKGQLVK